MTKISKTERNAACERLREWLKPGDTVFTILDSVSSSGMSRRIRFVILKNNEDGGTPIDLHPNYLIGLVLGLPQGKRDALTVKGSGMDMGFHCVYNLGSALWPDGTPEPHGTRNGEPDSDGGYALKHRWL